MENPQNETPQNETPQDDTPQNDGNSSWISRHPIITVLIVLFLIGSVMQLCGYEPDKAPSEKSSDYKNWDFYPVGFDDVPGFYGACLVSAEETFKSQNGEDDTLLFGFMSYGGDNIVPVIAFKNSGSRFKGKNLIEITHNQKSYTLNFATIVRLMYGSAADDKFDNRMGAFGLFNDDDYVKTIYEGLYHDVYKSSFNDFTVSGPFGTAHFKASKIKKCHKKAFPQGTTFKID